VITWARDADTDKVLGFVVHKDNPGMTTQVIEHKIALRTVQNADIVYRDCRVPEVDRLQEARSFKDTAEILRRTRSGVAWSSVGVMLAAYEIALAYASPATGSCSTTTSAGSWPTPRRSTRTRAPGRSTRWSSAGPSPDTARSSERALVSPA
jgi:alkylation response protein AidB-like acyl-CoA dehydrogenase